MQCHSKGFPTYMKKENKLLELWPDSLDIFENFSKMSQG